MHWFKKKSVFVKLHYFKKWTLHLSKAQAFQTLCVSPQPQDGPPSAPWHGSPLPVTTQNNKTARSLRMQKICGPASPPATRELYKDLIPQLCTSCRIRRLTDIHIQTYQNVTDIRTRKQTYQNVTDMKTQKPMQMQTPDQTTIRNYSSTSTHIQ